MAKKRTVALWEGASVALIGTIFFATIGSPMLPYTRTHDFLSFYSGAKLLVEDRAHLYDPAAQAKVQYSIAPGIPVVSSFTRPAFAALSYAPLIWLPFKTAFVVWLAGSTLVLFGVWWWAYRRFGPEALIYCSFFSPVLLGILNGQDIAFLTAITLLAYLAGSKQMEVLAGVLLACLLIKFHLFLIVPLVLVVQQKWRMLAGYCAAAACAVAATFAISSPQAYIALLTNPSLEAINTSRHMMINIHALFVNFGIDNGFAKLAAAAVVGAFVLAIPKGVPFDRWFWGMIAGGLLISPHTFVYDAGFLLVPILLILFEPRISSDPQWRQWIAATAVIPLPYFLTLLPKPFACIPALVILALFLAIAYPAWFERAEANWRILWAKPLIS